MIKIIMLLCILYINLLANEKSVLIEIKFEQGKYSLQRAWLVSKKLRATMGVSVKTDEDIIITFKNGNYTKIDSIRIENPNIIRGILSKNSNGEGHNNFVQKSGTFIVRYPYTSNIKFISINNATVQVTNNTKTANVVEYKNNLNLDEILDK